MRPSSKRTAAILTLFVFLLPVVITMLGFCIDASYMQLVQTELRMATDNATRVAADDFARYEKKDSARAKGKSMAQKFTVAGKKLRLKDNDFEFGRSVMDADGAYGFVPDGFPPNAVRVIAARDAGSMGGPVPLFFSRFIGNANFEPTATSVAAFLNVDICLVLDRSSSMKMPVDTTQLGMSITDARFCKPPDDKSRWKALENGVKKFLDVLNKNAADELVAVVTYGSDLDTVMPGICGREPEATLDLALNSSLKAVLQEVEDRSDTVWNGNTFIAAGIDLARVELKTNGRSFAEKVMIVLTDGLPTQGDAVASAAAARAEGIRVYTITFGIAADQVHMLAVANAGEGQHAHATDADSLEEIFRLFAASATKLVQ